MKWKPVKGYEDSYLVSDSGFVQSLLSNIILKQFPNQNGYLRINLMKYGKLKQVFVHRLVAEAFLGEIPKGFQVNHKDGNKQNNNLDNLEIVTNRENMKHANYVLGYRLNPVLMLDKDTFEIKKEFQNIATASKELDIDDASIYRVCTNERNMAGGYSWAFKNEFNEELVIKKKQKLSQKYKSRSKKIQQIHPATNEILTVYESLLEATNKTGIKTIVMCVNGYCKTAGGFRWKYINSEVFND